jgi:hypothetical protein
MAGLPQRRPSVKMWRHWKRVGSVSGVMISGVMRGTPSPGVFLRKVLDRCELGVDLIASANARLHAEKEKAAGANSPGAALDLFFYFYFNKLSGINLSRLFREVALWFVWVAGFSTVSGA